MGAASDMSNQGLTPPPSSAGTAPQDLAAAAQRRKYAALAARMGRTSFFRAPGGLGGAQGGGTGMGAAPAGGLGGGPSSFGTKSTLGGK